MSAISHQGQCDVCQAEGVPRRRYWVSRPDEDKEFRSVLLCNSCRAPLEHIFATVPKKVDNRPIVAVDPKKLAPSKTLIAQRKRPRRTVRKATS